MSAPTSKKLVSENLKVLSPIEINKVSPWKAVFGYKHLRLSAVPLGRVTVAVSNFKEFIKRLPSDEELEKWTEKRDYEGVALVTGYKGLTAFDVDGKEAKELLWDIFKQFFGDYPEKKTWVERRIDPRDGSEHYHVYMIYEDFEHTKPTEGVEKLYTADGGQEVALIYNHWVRATPSFHQGSNYEWIHETSGLLRVSKKNFIAFVRAINPYFDVKRKGEEGTKGVVEEEKVPSEPDKELTDEQIGEILSLIEPRFPKPGHGRGLFILGLSGLLAYLGVKKESALKIVQRIHEEIDTAKEQQKLRIWKAEVEATYSRVKEKKPIAIRHWLRSLGWTEEEIDAFRNEVLRVIKPKVNEFFKRQISFTLKTNFFTTTIEFEDGTEVKYNGIKRWIIKPTEKGYIVHEVVQELYPAEENSDAPIFKNVISYEPITPKNTKIKKVVDLGDHVYIELVIDGNLEMGSIVEVVEKLAKEGKVRSKFKEDFKAFLVFLSKTVEKDKVFEAPGIYLDEESGVFIDVLPGNDKVHLYPIHPLSRDWTFRIFQSQKRIKSQDYRTFLEAIVKYKKYFPEGAYYIGMSYMAISPFFHSIVGVSGLKPALFFKGPKGTGKSFLAKFIVLNAFSGETVKQDTFNSAFREGAILSSATFPLLLDDIDQWNAKTLAKLKATMTGSVSMLRGKPDQSIERYEEKTTYIITANKDVFEGLDPAYRDRIIFVDVRQEVSPKKKIAYRREINFPVGIENGKGYAHFFVPDLVRVVNALGGYEYIQERFIQWLSEAELQGITEGRNSEKYALLLIGTEILHNLLKGYGLDFDFERAKEVITDFFKSQDSKSIPTDLKNLVYAISKSKLENAEEEELYIPFNEKRQAYIIGTTELEDIREHFSKRELPENISEIASIVVDVFPEYKFEDLYGFVKDKINGKKRSRRVVFVPRKVYEYVLGYIELEEELKGEVAEVKEVNWKQKVLEELEKGEKSFDNLLELGVPEKTLRDIIIELERNGKVIVKDGVYRLLTKKQKAEAKEKTEETKEPEEEDEDVEEIFENAEFEEKEFRWDDE